MTERSMERLKVYTDDKDYICIAQDYPDGEDSVIIVHPDQVDLLIKWLKEAKDELQNN